jgi:serine/threonine protein kinase
MSEAHQREQEIFDAALELPPQERAAYLDRVTEGDIALRGRIESLLKGYEAGNFLEQPAAPRTLQRTMVISDPPTEKPGDKIGRFKLLQQIGEGGCGVVYMAEQEEPVRRRVALKIIKLGMDTKSVIARFEAERQALALMDHPNIAKVFDAGATETGRPYFVMELVRGMKITDYCDEAKLPIRERLDLFTQVCQAVQHAHQKGIIHRDLKPSNILVTVNDGVAVPKVIDFGIAKATGGQRLTDKTIFTAFEQFIGTPAYMSPEQAVLTSVDIDTRSDIYALGVLLYELLTGKTPFESAKLLATGFDEMRRVIREQEPSRPSTRLSTMPDNELSTAAQRRGIDAPKLVTELRGDLDWIVMKCLEKDRARRYETANGLAKDIERLLNNEPVTARPPSTAYRLRKMVRRNKLTFAAVSAVVISLMAGLVVSTALFFRAKQERDEAVKQKQRADEQAAVAKAVSDFLQSDLLSQASSRQQAESGFEPLPDLTVRAALQRAAAKVGQRFTNQPLVESEIRYTLGSSFVLVGDAQAAIPQLERSVLLRTQMFGQSDSSTLSSMHMLAWAYQDAGQLTNALAAAEEALRLRKAKFSPDDEHLLSAMNLLANVKSGLQQDNLALREEIFRLSKEKLGTNNELTLIAMGNLATAYSWTSNRADEGLRMLEETLRLEKETLATNHPLTLSSMDHLAGAYSRRKRLAEAIPLFEDTLNLQMAALGSGHPDTQETLNDLADAYSKAGRAVDSIALRERYLIEIKTILGPDNPNTLSAMHRLADLYTSSGRENESFTLSEEALKLARARFGPDDPSTIESIRYMERAYRNAGQLTNAIALGEEGLRRSTAKLGPDDAETFWNMYDLSQTYGKAGLTNAVALAAEAFNRSQRRLGWDSTTHYMARELVSRYEQFKQASNAIPLREEILAHDKTELVTDDPQLLQDMANLANNYRDAGRLAEAIALYEEVLSRSTAKFGPNHTNTIARLYPLARAYELAKRPQDAIPLYETELKFRETNAPDDDQTLFARNHLARVYRDARRLADAATVDEGTLQSWKFSSDSDTNRLAVLSHLASIYELQGEFVKAENDLREGINLDKPPYDYHHFNAELAVGRLLLKQNKFADAEPLLLSGYEGFKGDAENKPADGQRIKNLLASNLKTIVHIYSDASQTNFAAQWQRKIDELTQITKPATNATPVNP